MVHPVQVGKRTRMSFAKVKDVTEMPNLIEVQLDSYEWFLREGLLEVFDDVNPISNFTGNLVLEFVDYKLDMDNIKYSVEECKERDCTYAAPLKVSVRLTNNETGEKPSKPSHTHSWNAQTTVVHHPASGHNEQVLIKEAWTEYKPIYETVAIEVCNTCGADITANHSQHMKEHALKGEGGSRRTEYIQKQTGTETIAHPAEYETRWVQDSAAWDETVITGYTCSCGASK